MGVFKLKVAIDLLSKKSTVTRKYGTAEIESANGFLNKESDTLKQLLRQHYQSQFKDLAVLNVDVLGSLSIA